MEVSVIVGVDTSVFVGAGVSVAVSGVLEAMIMGDAVNCSLTWVAMELLCAGFAAPKKLHDSTRKKIPDGIMNFFIR